MKIDVDKSLLKSLLVMAEVIEARDPYTGGHVWRVSQFAKLLSKKIGLPDDEAIQVSISGYLHDLGKVGIPDSILLKPDKLTNQEYDVIKTHPVIGAKLIEEHPLSPMVYDPILHHHERPDGRGYPENLDKDLITLRSRIIGITDAFDAMTSTRPYRKGMPQEKALSILKEEKGNQFDAFLVDNMCALGEAGDLEHIVGHSSEGIPLAVCPCCGPVIAVPRNVKDGDIVYCKACSGEFRLHQHKETFETECTGNCGDAEKIKPDADTEYICEIVDQIPEQLTLSEC